MSILGITRVAAAAMLLLNAPTLLAQDESPAISTPVERPAAQSEGTVIVGDRESPIGLFITPWRDSSAQEDMDRPARLLQADMLPLEEAVFVRQIEYHRALTGALQQRNEVSPNVPAPLAAPASQP